MSEHEVEVVQDQNSEALALTPVMDLKTAKARLREFQEFIKGYLVESEDFGTIPGTPKPTLYKPGADKLCEVYGLSDDYEILDKLEDWSMMPPLFDYTIKCMLRSKRSGVLVATGLGSCNSYEGKYRWRELKRTCPKCGKHTIIKGKEEYGGGWLCWRKEGKSDGCGAKFADGATEILSQEVGKVENDDIATLKNTILKMSKKRAKIDATLAATRSSGVFTQDIEDIGAEIINGQQPAPAPAQRKVQKPKATQTNATAAEPENAPVEQQGTSTIEVTGIIESVSGVKKNARNNEYVVVVVDGKDLYLFHHQLMPTVMALRGHEVAFVCNRRVSQDKVWLSIEEILGQAEPAVFEDEP